VIGEEFGIPQETYISYIIANEGNKDTINGVKSLMDE
jgi:hypothetical protein